MDQGPLVKEQIEAGSQLASQFETYAPLKAVFWLKESDAGRWYLYLASDQIDASNFALAYAEVVRLLQGKSHLWLNLLQVKVTGTKDPLVKEVVSIQRKYPLPEGLRLGNTLIGGRYVEDMYIYPEQVTTTT